MKTYKFEITLTEEMLEGDEFWENAIADHPTGIPNLTEALQQCILDYHLITDDEIDMNEVVTLIEYKEK